MNVGENGRGVASRWYPETLAKRLRALGSMSHAVEFVEGDAFRLIQKHLESKDVAFLSTRLTPLAWASAQDAGFTGTAS